MSTLILSSFIAKVEQAMVNTLSNLKEVLSFHASQSGQEFTNIIVISSHHALESLMDFLIT